MKSFLRIIALFLLCAPDVTNARASSKAVKVVVQEPRELKNYEMAASGALATAFGVVIMHPVDTIKTLQQSNNGIGLNMVAATNKIMKGGGLGALYSGLGPYVVSDGCAGALKFATYEILKKWIKEKVPEEHYGKALYIAAAAAFIASSVVLVPGELLKQRLQMGQIASVRQGIPQILKSEGILGFYAGYSGVCLRDIPYTMMELGIYDNLKDMIVQFKNRNAAEGEKRPGGQMEELLAAAISGGFTGFLTAPLDNIKTKLMVDVGYTGFFDCLFKTAKNNGVPSLFAGSAARVAWLMPFTAIYLPVYEILKRKIQETPVALPGPLAVKGGHVRNNNLGNRAFRRPVAFQQPYSRRSRPVCF